MSGENDVCICTHTRRRHSRIAPSRGLPAKAWCSGKLGCPCPEFLRFTDEDAGDRAWTAHKDATARGSRG